MNGSRPTVRTVLVDANVLFSRALRDALLYLALERIIRVRWSTEILSELRRNLVDKTRAVDEFAAARLITALDASFPLARVERDEDAERVVEWVKLPDPSDLHVLAAAIATQADLICTNNRRDFPPELVADFGIDVVSADELLTQLAREFPDETLRAHHATVAGFRGATTGSCLAALERAGATTFAEQMRHLLNT